MVPLTGALQPQKKLNCSTGDYFDYVLGKWNTEERESIDQVVDRATDAVELVISQGLEAAIGGGVRVGGGSGPGAPAWLLAQWFTLVGAAARALLWSFTNIRGFTTDATLRGRRRPDSRLWSTAVNGDPHPWARVAAAAPRRFAP